MPLEMNDVLADECPFLYARLWKRHVAAAIIQRMVRGHLARKMVEVMRSESMSKSTMDPETESEEFVFMKVEIVYDNYGWNGLPVYANEADRWADDYLGR